jgi:hypothetical protein
MTKEEIIKLAQTDPNAAKQGMVELGQTNPVEFLELLALVFFGDDQ